MKKEKRSCRIDTRYTPSELQNIKSASENRNVTMSEFSRESTLKACDSKITDTGNGYKLVPKTEIGIWYIDTVNTINSVTNSDVKKELFGRLEELECLLLK